MRMSIRMLFHKWMYIFQSAIPLSHKKKNTIVLAILLKSVEDCTKAKRKGNKHNKHKPIFTQLSMRNQTILIYLVYSSTFTILWKISQRRLWKLELWSTSLQIIMFRSNFLLQ